MAANDVFNFRVADPETGLRLDTLVATHLDQCSRSYAAQLIRQGHILVDGVARKSSYTVKLNETISGRLPPPEPLDVCPEALPLDILFEDPFHCRKRIFN